MPGIIKNTVRKLRREQTDSEALVWELLRNRRFKGYKFNRQQPISYRYLENKRFFVADFYSAELKLVIEIDGKIHENQKEYDEFRSLIINQLGIRVARITNEEANDKMLLLKFLQTIIK